MLSGEEKRIAKTENKELCKSVFKEGDSTTSARFTAKWIEWINRIEKEKAQLMQAEKKSKWL